MLGHLVLIYGPPLSGKSTAAVEIARGFDSKTAIVSVDRLLDAIPVPDADALAEIEMVHIQLRLLVANYLKNGYNVVVEGPFAFERDGRLHSYEREIGELAALMRNLATSTLVVRLKADEGTLRQRAPAAEAESAGRLQDLYRERFGRMMTLDSGVMSPAEIAAKVRQALSAV